MPGTSSTIDDLIDRVRQLSPKDRSEFAARLVEYQANGDDVSSRLLVRQTKMRLKAVERRRLQALVTKSERGQLSDTELQDYRRLAQRAERINVARVVALAELARRGGQSLDQTKQEIGWQEDRHGA